MESNEQPAVCSPTSQHIVDLLEKKGNFRFTVADDCILLREVLTYQQPFVRRSNVWPAVANSLCQLDRYKALSARTFRERTCLIIVKYMKNDNYRRQQAGREAEYAEKDRLLEECKKLYVQQVAKPGVTDSAAEWIDEDTEMVGEDLISTTPERLPKKRSSSQESPWPQPPSKRRQATFSDACSPSLEQRELSLREREMKLKEDAAKLELEKLEITRMQAETEKAKAESEAVAKKAQAEQMKTLIEGQNQLIRLLLEQRK